MERTKLLIDTDIGDDIDDLFALYFALRKGVEIVGVTTVFKDTVQRAKMVKKLFNEFGEGYEKVPVYAGYGTPLNGVGGDKEKLCQYTPDIEQFSPDNEREEEAVDFIISACEKYGSELTIVAIGPFTNIAKAIQKKPNVFHNVSFVIMGGAFFRQYADWNVMCDVESAKIMFDNVPSLECLGADVTHKLDITDKEKAEILDYKNHGMNKAGRYVSEIFGIFTNYNRPMYLHDPLAVYFPTNREICTMEKARVEVLTEGIMRGITFNIDAYNKAYMNPYCAGYENKNRISVAKDVKKQEFTQTFMAVFKD
ncbi:MAG: nucleoside hydrolase [Clostridia bacterium]|nr:nucleoside hydrolase [Clostridia bacterium]